MPYPVYVDEEDMVWLGDFGSNSIAYFDAMDEIFEVFNPPSHEANVRQILGRTGAYLSESQDTRDRCRCRELTDLSRNSIVKSV